MKQEFFFTAIDGEILAGEIDYPEKQAVNSGLIFFIPGAFACDRDGTPLGLTGRKMITAIIINGEKSNFEIKSIISSEFTIFAMIANQIILVFQN